MRYGLAIATVAVTILLVAFDVVRAESWQETEHEVLVRSQRGVKENPAQACRYNKGTWSECDPRTNTRTRTLTLKKGDTATCQETKTVQKKCKKGAAKSGSEKSTKACRYNKGTWGECINGSMTRTDNLRANGDPSCEQSRKTTKKCKAVVTAKRAKGNRRKDRQ